NDVLQAKEGRRWWCCEAGDATTTLWADFGDADPNAALVEIHVRRACFYPTMPGMNFITVRGFVMQHAATQWAPPTAEQIGLIGAHWCMGWIIEDNDVSHSRCTGITLGKYGDPWDNTSQNSAEGYVTTLERALENGWAKGKIGHHVVRNNRIAHCEQAGIVGSLGAAFSLVTGNVIHDIHVRRQFGGAEMAGIKFHGAIDTIISRNHVFRSNRGIWLDWMTQGTRVTCNLLHDNGPSEDLFVEVNHGPFLVDNNVFLSPIAMLEASQGGAYVHNLFAGKIITRSELSRLTPFHAAHATTVAGLRNISVNDERFVNNLFVGLGGPALGGLAAYRTPEEPLQASGNVFVRGAQPSPRDVEFVHDEAFGVGLELLERPDGIFLRLAMDPAWADAAPRPLVTTDLLGNAHVPNLPFVQPDGAPYRLDTDYHGAKRCLENPFPGPFVGPAGKDRATIRVWPNVSEAE
ncbi:MAG: right-handed parallel beta-helix repeat-containing protein, partial [Patescibacteria group bacterium]|nr:right-handed parallel beta-helix repeat-containing protein [Patescibacteria group bacterium]